MMHDGLTHRVPNRALTPAEDLRVARARSYGVPAAVLASRFGVSVRTIHRAARRAGEPVTRARLNGWWADFRMTDEGPVQVTGWYADRDAEEATWHD